MVRIVEILAKPRMYKSKCRAVRKAAAAIAECVRWSKIGCYETPYDVTGIVQHTGLKGNLSAVETNRNIGTRKVPDVEPLWAEKR